MIKKLIRKSLSLFGYELNKINNITFDPRGAKEFNGFDLQSNGKKAVELTAAYSMMPYINLFTLYEQAAYCENKNIEGDYVECGVWKGGAVGIMAKANLDYGKKRRLIHLFDSFDDICPPDAEIDGEKAIAETREFGGMNNVDEMKGQLEPVKGIYDKLGGHGTIDSCKELLENKIKYPTEFIQYHKGWFQNVLPVKASKIDKIAILRLDGDWYNSILVCLDYLFDKVVSGGLVIIDDYGYYDGCTKAVDEFLERRKIKTFLSYSSVGCRYFIKN